MLTPQLRNALLWSQDRCLFESSPAVKIGLSSSAARGSMKVDVDKVLPNGRLAHSPRERLRMRRRRLRGKGEDGQPINKADIQVTLHPCGYPEHIQYHCIRHRIP